jgi:hypothetical protein
MRLSNEEQSAEDKGSLFCQQDPQKRYSVGEVYNNHNRYRAAIGLGWPKRADEPSCHSQTSFPGPDGVLCDSQIGLMP